MDLLGGGANGELWPTRGRIFAVSPQDTFHVFAEAIDDACSPLDRGHLHEFETVRLGRTVTEFRFSGGEEDPERELTPLRRRHGRWPPATRTSTSAGAKLPMLICSCRWMEIVLQGRGR